MVKKKLMIQIVDGLHLRPIHVLCNRSIEYSSEIIIKTKDREINAKSLLSVLAAGIRYGDEIELICNGVDEEQAMEELSTMIENGLGDVKESLPTRNNNL